jgi:hypothetical protein
MAQNATSLKEIRDAVNAVGLKLTSDELKALQEKQVVSLESKPLSAVANLITQAEAIYKQENPRKTLTYTDAKEKLTAKARPSARTSGCRGLKVVKVGQNCGIYVHWPPGISLCCTF